MPCARYEPCKHDAHSCLGSVLGPPPGLTFVYAPLPRSITSELLNQFVANHEQLIRQFVAQNVPPHLALFVLSTIRPLLIAPLKRGPFLSKMVHSLNTIMSASRKRATLTIERWKSATGDTRKVLDRLQPMLSVMSSVNKAFWDEVLPAVVDAALRGYMDTTPTAPYGEDVHEQHVRTAMALIASRLPFRLFEQVESAIRLQFAHRWTRSGRRRCPALSIAGRPCIHTYHCIPGDDAASLADLPEKRHSSGYSTIRSCDCGARQVTLGDPFRVADMDQLFLDCCRESRLDMGDLEVGWKAFSYADDPQRVSGLQEWKPLGVMSSAIVLIGFEFDCDAGHRFMVPVRDPIRDTICTASESTSAIFGSRFPIVDFPLRRLSCPSCQFQSASRLRHIYIRAPPAGCPEIKFRPQCCRTRRCRAGRRDDQILDRDGNRVSLSIDASNTAAVAIPVDQLIALSVPILVTTPDGRVADESDAVEVVLRPGTFFAGPAPSHAYA
ncbi:hypothetical protein PBRA_005070 [Plasmodiophora brassicae]|uniref:Nonsense-mediated mRNA decay factor SMG8 n=1 Tax=Plasmodiophora brassicae TaxID=37360 RepID=A0A0G4IMM4_PLABS|nr:hypothetical protein PBRA_005070 [Plasmodiophora brassicae]